MGHQQTEHGARCQHCREKSVLNREVGVVPGHEGWGRLAICSVDYIGTVAGPGAGPRGRAAKAR